MEVYTKQEIDQLIANIERPPFVAIPTFISLMGPRQGDGLLVLPVGTEWKFLTALTASTKMFCFNLGVLEVAYARWVVIWTSNNVAVNARLVSFDYATNEVMQNPVELALAEADGAMAPRAVAKEITGQLNDLAKSKVTKQIGFQVKDDGVNNWLLYESRLEITYKLPRGYT